MAPSVQITAIICLTIQGLALTFVLFCWLANNAKMKK